MVIGGSAGAFEPLGRLVALLPKDLPASVFVALHLSPDFPSVIPQLLAKRSQVPVRHAMNHEVIQGGTVLVAPPDHHLLIQDSEVVLSRGPKENRHRPAIDVLFRSAARTYGPRVAAVVLSGQLDDGSAGLMAVKMRGGLSIVQDPKEAMAPEMPTRAIEYAGADHVLSVDQIAEFLVSISSEELPFPEDSEAEVSEELEDEARQANLEEPLDYRTNGNPSVFACPECHGVLWEVQDGRLLRFRCRVGHAYTADTLQVALSESGEHALWVAMRTLEEKAALLRRMAHRTGRHMAAHYREEAAGFDVHAETIRKMLLENQALLKKEEETSTSERVESGAEAPK